MSQTNTAIMIVSGVLILFGVPFFLGVIEVIMTNNQTMLSSLILAGFTIASFCLLVLIIGVWLDGLH